eukprot:3940735-Rhodomonas_salina.3
MPCPVLTYPTLLPAHVTWALSTVAESHAEAIRYPIPLRAPYAVSGTHLAYRPTRCPVHSLVLTSAIVLYRP